MRAEISPSHPAILHDALHRLLPILAAALIFLVYLGTMAPSVFSLDSAELTTAAYSLGLVHSPGYPVYLLLAHLFIKMPIADVGFRMNMFSGLASALNVAVLIAVIREMTGRFLPAVAAGLSFGLSYYVWTASVVAEVYALQGLMLSSMLLAILQWHKHGKRIYLHYLAAIAGLAVANNPATLLWFPGLIVLIGFTPAVQKMDRRTAASTLAVYILAFSAILYLPLRSALQPSFINVGHFDHRAVFHPLDLTRPANLFWYLTGGQFEPLFFAYTPFGYLGESLQFFYWLWAAFLGVGLPIGFWGVFRVWRWDRQVALGLLVILILHTVFFIGYRAADKDTMFLPVFVIWTIFIGIGLGAFLETISSKLRLVVFAMPLALFVVNAPYADVSNFYVPVEVAQIRLQSAESDAIYLARWGEAEAMQYHQVVNRIRPDVTVVNLFFTRPEDLTRLIKFAIRHGRPVYSASAIPELEDWISLNEAAHGYFVELEGKKK